MVTLLAVITGFAIFGTGSAHAQGEEHDYVDVGLKLEAVEESVEGLQLNITVVNHGSRTAYDVDVEVDIAYPEDSSYFHSVPDVPIGSASIENDGYSFHWIMPELRGLKSEKITVHVTNVHYDDMNNLVFDRKEYIHKYVGEVTTSSFESDLHKGNNTDQSWSVLTNPNDDVNEPAWSTYSVNVAVDERHPSPGDFVNFTITANHGHAVIDQEVAIELTDGLAVDEDAGATPSREISYTPNDKAASVSYSDGVFNIGTLKHSDYKQNHSVTLPIRVSNNAVVNEQCLTATITGNPPPGTGPRDDDISDNVAKLCLGTQPVAPFVSGQVDAFTVYPCVGDADAPCDSANDIRVRAVAASGAALSSGAAVFWLDPLKARIYDDHTNASNVLQSVNDGNTVSWQTAVDPERDYKDGLDSGVELYYSRTPFVNKTSGWGGLSFGISARDIDGIIPPPGKVFLRATHNGNEIRKAESPNYEELRTTATSISTSKLNYFLEFEKLGTYKFTWHAVAKRTSLHGSENCNPNTANPPVNQIFCGSETFTFHIGPMADLAVEDGGASSHAASDQHALTIVAVNNGPDDAGSAQVTGLPTGAEVVHISRGDYNSTDGEWDIGELKVRGYYRSRGEPDPTLVLSASAEDTVNVSIANTENYEVCVGPKDNPGNLAHTTKADCEAVTNASWNSTPVYDYDADNNTATIAAQAGTGGGEGAPTLQAPAVHAPAVGVTWSEVEFLHGVPVKGYQVQWSTDGVNGWTQLETALTLPQLFDITIQAGQTRYYRVRAVNEAGVPGPWSAPMAAMPIDTSVPGISISEKALTIREGGSAEYTVTLHARPHSNVTVRVNGGGVVTPNPGTLTFTTADFNMPKTVELTGIQDNDPDDEQVNVTHSISSSDAGYRNLTPDPVAVTVIDADSGVSVSADQASVNEGDAIDFTLTRTGNTSGAITVELAVSQRGSFLPADQLGARFVSIEAGVTTETVTVRTQNDTVREDAGSVTLVLESGTGYLVGTPRSATVRVQDDDGVPGQPGNLTAEEDDRQVALSWEAAPVGDASVLDYSYRVRQSDRSTWDPDWTVLAAGGGRRNHTESRLTNGQEYVFQVRARNATGDGAVAEVRASPRTTPGRPDVTVSSRNASLLVTWDVPDNGGRPTTEYRVQWKSGGQSYDDSRQATVTAREHTIPNLTNGTEYRVRVLAMNEAGWGLWSYEQPGTPVLRPATSLSITTDAQDGVSEPFRVTFTFTDQDHDGTQYGVTGFDADDIEVWYPGTPGYKFSLKDFREEVTGFVYSARLDDILEGDLNIRVKASAAQSTHTDSQQSAAASFSIAVAVPEPKAPTGTEIWSAEMTVGDYPGNARGYINPGLSLWDPDDTVGSLSDGDEATDNDDAFTYGGQNYTVGEVSYAPAWTRMMFVLCPGLEGADRTFDLYLDDQNADHDDLSLSFDADEVNKYEFNRTIDGVQQTCVEYHWQPRQADWEEDGKVNVRLVK